MKKANKIVLLLSGILAAGLSIGSVFAAWAVTDNADPLGIKIEVKDNDRTVFLNGGGSTLWNQANAWFAAYCFSGGDKDPTFVTMEGTLETNYYSADIDGAYKKVIFLRMNPEADTPSFDTGKCWNQTEDITFVDGLDTYTITDFGNTKSTGEWSLHTCVAGEEVIENETEATCTQDGGYDTVKYCKICGKEISRVHTTIPAGHKHVDHVEAVDPTCTENGNIEHWHCEDCEKYYSDSALTTEITQAQTIIDKTGHDFDTETWTSDSTGHWHACNNGCDEKNSFGAHTPNEDGICTVCGYQVFIPAHTHTMQHTAAVPATCTEDGNIEYWYCTGCEKYFDSEAGDHEIEPADIVVEAHGHDYSIISYVWSGDNSTCSATATCSYDSSHKIIEIKDTTITSEIPATCTTKGSRDYSVSFDNPLFETQTKTGVEIPKLDHDYDTSTHRCKDCDTLDPNYVEVTFKVNYDTNNNGDLYLLGDKTGWSASSSNMMTWTSGNNWTFTYIGKIGETMGFKFYRSYAGGGGIWERDGEGNERKYKFATSTTVTLNWGNY